MLSQILQYFLKCHSRECMQKRVMGQFDFHRHKVPRSYSQALPIHAQKRRANRAKKRLLVYGTRDDEALKISKLTHYQKTRTQSITIDSRSFCGICLFRSVVISVAYATWARARSAVQPSAPAGMAPCAASSPRRFSTCDFTVRICWSLHPSRAPHSRTE